MAIVSKTYIGLGTFTAPANVDSVRVEARRKAAPLPLYHYGLSGSNVTGMIDSTGQLYCWGLGTTGQVGDGAAVSRSSPTAVLAGTKWNFVIQGGLHMAGITSDGLWKGWGYDAFGDAGDNNSSQNNTPAVNAGGRPFWMGAAQCNSNGIGPILAIATDNTMWGWGPNTGGQLGDGTAVTKSSPVPVVGGLKWGRIYSTNNVLLALTTTGAPYIWGAANGASSPVPVPSAQTFGYGAVQGNGGAYFGMASDGTLYAWGVNTSGSLGTGAGNPGSPTAVLGSNKYTAISTVAGNSSSLYTLAIATDKTLWSFGFNASGNLGDNSTTNRSSPVPVAGGLKFSYVLADRLPSSYGITTDGSLYAWGDNTFGQLGDGTTTSRSSPVPVASTQKFVTVHTNGKGTAFATTTTGRLYSWGQNTNGEMGDGTVITKSSPTLVVGVRSPAIQDIVTTTTIPVTPGTSYSINVLQYFGKFGTTIIGAGIVDSVVVTYET